MARTRPYGPDAWLVDDIDDPVAWAVALAARGLDGVDEVVPAASSVLVCCDRRHHDAIGTELAALRPGALGVEDGDGELVIDVVYDGADLGAVADVCGLTIEGVIDHHQRGEYRVAFCGFSPGFGYLRGVDERLHVARRATPRTSVPAGSVGLAAGFTCVYPSASPGGWHLLGRTGRTMWDQERDPPGELWPGRRVRFRRVDP